INSYGRHGPRAPLPGSLTMARRRNPGVATENCGQDLSGPGFLAPLGRGVEAKPRRRGGGARWRRAGQRTPRWRKSGRGNGEPWPRPFRTWVPRPSGGTCQGEADTEGGGSEVGKGGARQCQVEEIRAGQRRTVAKTFQDLGSSPLWGEVSRRSR